jgi:hypothetical protein
VGEETAMKHLPILIATACLVAACDGPPPRARTVTEFAQDPTLLQGVMIRCEQQRTSGARDPECANALAAADRLAADDAARRSGERAAEFERQREQRRVEEEQRRQAAERATPKFDPYSSPVNTDVAAPPAPATKP